ncbi:Tim44 domain-containing protein [Aquabacterium soli]|uniref:Tim44 domain-containing protein n=1 Tax=Aquabacterium soli TaxID=2493092 RepID=A0A426V909_9BURK|nr:Tim44-like domain-containing protein [Aquabacterium soli]RRS03406.1 Tim44 domain-containing protein [Aquabacterium soli]
MKKLLLAVSFALVGLSTTVVSFDVEAKRLGGGRPAGMQRQAPAKAPDAPPAKPGQPTNANAPTQGAAPAAAGAAAGAGKRSWMGPIAGIAAGLGIAALMSHLGMGEAFGNFLTMALLALVAVIAIRFLINRFRQNNGGGAARGAGPQLAGAGAPWAQQGNQAPQQSRSADVLSPMQREAQQAFSPAAPVAGALGGAAVSSVPEGFDAAGFERIAKMIFIRLQAANDASNVDDLRKFTTPELFASLRLDLQERGQAAQQTDVLQLDAELVETTQENGQWIASVRFHGLIREAADQGAEPFNELWHLVKPVDGDREWAIAGITPVQA